MIYTGVTVDGSAMLIIAVPARSLFRVTVKVTVSVTVKVTVSVTVKVTVTADVISTYSYLAQSRVSSVAYFRRSI